MANKLGVVWSLITIGVVAILAIVLWLAAPTILLWWLLIGVWPWQ